MLDLELWEVKEIELNILNEFHSICIENNLRYSLAYGTLLGAVRHKGFIPWDDDIDVMMPRPDFMKLVSIFDSKCKDPNLSLISMYNNDRYFAPLAKIHDKRTRVFQKYGQNEKEHFGVYIDVFVIDGLPETGEMEFYSFANKLREKWGFSCRKIFALHKSRNLLRDIAGSIYSLIYKIRGYRFYRDMYDSFCRSFEFESADNVAVIEFGEGLEKEKMKKEEIESFSELQFEGSLFHVIPNYEQYLVRMYGDYMQLPPENERISKHGSRFVWSK